MVKAWITYAWAEKCCTSLTSQLRHDYSPLIKLGLFKNFKALDKIGVWFYYLKEKFPRESDSKIKEGIFVGPQIRGLIRDGKFEDLLSQIEKSAWKSFKSIVKKFLSNYKAPNYREIVDELLQSYQDMGCNMSLKIQFLESHLDFFLSQSWCRQWRTRGRFSPRNFCVGKDIGVQECFLTIVGQWKGMFQIPNTEGNQQPSHFK